MSCLLRLLLCLTLQPITNSPPKWMAELETEDIEMLKGMYMYIHTTALYRLVVLGNLFSVPAVVGVKQEDRSECGQKQH